MEMPKHHEWNSQQAAPKVTLQQQAPQPQPSSATPTSTEFAQAKKEVESQKPAEKEMTREQLIDGAINAPFKVDSLNLVQSESQST